MGSALLAQWKKNPTYQVFVLDPSAKGSYATLDTLPGKQFNIIVLAVKPQVMDEVLVELTKRVTTSLVVSIAAGKSLKYLESKFPSGQPIIRTMPNTPTLVGKGVTVACGNQNVNKIQVDVTKALFLSSGKFEWITDENLMDAVTALSGSGPAYVFLLIEKMAKAAVAQGLPADLAIRLARQTVIGSAALAENQAETPAETLRKNVTSSGGTTEAALEVLLADDELGKLMDRAIAAAAKRSRELS